MTVDEPRMRVTTNLAFGICLILLGSVLILDRLHLVVAEQLLRFWPVALVVFGAAMVLQSFQHVDATAAPRRERDRFGHFLIFIIVAAIFWNGRFTPSAVRIDSTEEMSVVAVLGSHQQISNAAAFRGGEMTAILGRADLDLRQTTIAPGTEAVIELFTLMGGSTIRVPEGWSVDVRATPVMGGVRDRREGPHDIAGAPRLIIRGFIMWGGLDIKS